MEMLELIELIYDMKGNTLKFHVIEETYQRMVSKVQSSVVWYFGEKDEVIPFLFDKHIFGWEVREWDIFKLSDTCKSMTITIVRID